MSLKGRLRKFTSTQTKEDCSYFPNNRKELIDIITDRVKEDPHCDLNDVWVGDIIDMGDLFYGISFKGDISRWDVSNVKRMDDMFGGSAFNGDISSLDVRNVKDVREMFLNCPLAKNHLMWYNIKK